MAELLLEKETINHDDLVTLIGARPFKAHKSYLEFISANEEAKQKMADGGKDDADAATKAKATDDGDDAAAATGDGDGDSSDSAKAGEKEGAAASSSSKEP